MLCFQKPPTTISSATTSPTFWRMVSVRYAESSGVDERSVQLDITWVLTDPSGKEVGKVDQSNPVPVAATKGSWVGFGDIVAAAAVEGVLELLDKALAKQQR